jgi:5-methylcytosine-specific restriction enzyme A
MVDKLKGRTSTRWDALSKRYRRLNPLCEMCLKEGRIKEAYAVDHKVPHKGDVDLLFDLENLQSLCIGCHNAAKQAIERRGYDNAIAIDGWPIDTTHPIYQKKEKK